MRNDGELRKFEGDGRKLIVGIVRPHLHYRESTSKTVRDILRSSPNLLLSINSTSEPKSLAPRGIMEIFAWFGSSWKPLDHVQRLAAQKGIDLVIEGIEPDVSDALKDTNLTAEELFAVFALNNLHFTWRMKSTPSDLSHEGYANRLSCLVDSFVAWSGVDKKNLESVDTIRELILWYRLKEGREFSPNRDAMHFLPTELGGNGDGIWQIVNSVVELRKSYILDKIREKASITQTLAILTDAYTYQIIEPMLVKSFGEPDQLRDKY